MGDAPADLMETARDVWDSIQTGTTGSGVELAADQNAEKLTKTPFRYVPLWFVAELAWVMWHGAQKAGRSLDCWKELEKDRVLLDYPEAAMRHLQAIQEQGLGARDAESGRLHAVHVAGCAIIMAWHGTFC